MAFQQFTPSSFEPTLDMDATLVALTELGGPRRLVEYVADVPIMAAEGGHFQRWTAPDPDAVERAIWVSVFDFSSSQWLPYFIVESAFLGGAITPRGVLLVGTDASLAVLPPSSSVPREHSAR